MRSSAALIDGDWPYLWIDATYSKVREAGRIVSVAVIIAVVVNTDGVRKVLAMAVGPWEAEPFWSGFLRSLTRRGLRGVKLVISDAHEGLKAAAAKVTEVDVAALPGSRHGVELRRSIIQPRSGVTIMNPYPFRSLRPTPRAPAATRPAHTTGQLDARAGT